MGRPEEGRRRIYRSRAVRRRRLLVLVFTLVVLAAIVGTVGARGGKRVTYDRAAAARYADAWAMSANPGFWRSPDADCANFVSQCLAAGGLRPLSEPGVEWHANGADFPSLSWCNCDHQKHELRRETSTHTPYIVACSATRPRRWAAGDIVYLGDAVDDRTVWKHVIICVGKEDGVWVYDSHTVPHLRQPLTTWYPEHFSLIRYCRIADSVSYR